jgi:hypothetical protein
VALVTPHNWLFLGAYLKIRRRLLKEAQWDFVACLGPKGFQTPMYDFSIVLLALTNQHPEEKHQFMGLDVADKPTPTEKASSLCCESSAQFGQKERLNNPDGRVALTEPSKLPILGESVTCLTGILNGDSPRFQKFFWEFSFRPHEWAFQQSTVGTTIPFGGREQVVFFDEQNGHLREEAAIRRERLHDSDQRGNSVWGKRGLLVHRMGDLPVTLYTGEIFDQNGAAIVPSDEKLIAAVWCFVSSEEYARTVRLLDNKVGVTPATLSKVPFDLEHWQQVATEKYPHGLPKPYSTDPTQWLFSGHPKGSDHPLQAAVARLLGYRWPRQTGSSFPDCPTLGTDGLEKFADSDGIVCISAIKGEEPAAERLRSLLAAAYGSEWSAAKQTELLTQVSYVRKSLEDWLRNGFFEQHCALFHHRPFIWHIWDGRNDGFSALVNYHQLTKANLEKLTYSYLGDWISRQKAAVASGEAGSDARLQAAKELQGELQKILEGEPPYDIFVRWKGIEKQSIGWDPDLNDGVRLNIRPFMSAKDVSKKGAGILRAKPNIHWKKDRGTDVTSAPWFKVFKGERINGHHLTLDEKRKARAAHRT